MFALFRIATIVLLWLSFGMVACGQIRQVSQVSQSEFNPIEIEVNQVAAKNATKPKTQKPNFIILFLDDAGYGDFGCFGHPTIRTPNIDRMASEGMKFTQFYSASPACTASRYGLMTGRYPIRSGFSWVLSPNSPRGIHEKEITLGEALQDQGYATACFGKWHLGNKHEYLPLQNGFDEYLGLPYSNDMQAPKYPKIPLIEGNEAIEYEPDQGQLTRRYTERALEFIKKNKSKPFFTYVPYAMPHLPLHTNDRFRDTSARGLYGDVIEEIDWSVGQILQTLRNEGLDENTLVFFTSDNGPWIIKNEKGGSSGLFRDGKGSTWEGGVRVPAIAWWPKNIQPASTCQEVTGTIDLFPTLGKLAGGDVPGDRTIDGRSLEDELQGVASENPRTSMFYFGPGNTLHAVRSGAWKLNVKTSSQTRKKYFDGKLPLLFQIEHDPGEQYDLTEANADIVEQLQESIDQFKQSLKEEPPYWEAAESRSPGKQDHKRLSNVSHVQETDTKADDMPFIQVLGVAQDAGFPQAACKKDCCRLAWADRNLQRNATSIAIVDPKSKQRWLIECTPDFPQQLHDLDQVTPFESTSLLDGILLTHAHIGHYTGLIHLGREVIGANSIKVFAMPRMAEFLTNNGPWNQLISLKNIAISKIKGNEEFSLNERIKVIPIVVPHRDEFSETVGYKIVGPNRSVLFLPDIDKWERWEGSIEDMIDDLDVAYVDGTFFGEGELPGRNMSEIPHPFVVESIKRFGSLSKENRAKIRFIHLNHTNPLLQKDSPEEAQIIRAGMKVAKQGERIKL